MFERFWDRDTWLVQQKFKIVLVVLLVFLVSMIKSCNEMRYWISGKTTIAQASTRVDQEIRHGETFPQRVLAYNYDDAGKSCSNYVNVPMDWPGKGQSTVKIQYIPGSELSRISGQSNMVWVIIFFASLAAAAVGVVILVKTA
jgi:hypothetical protein